ncbi:MAG: hypothetical protein GY755_21945 [Chloroflexi bacterium]|nr:hypothetical protein [Chloroflexota bacterium]
MKLIIVDYNGWEKTVMLDKAVVRIGSTNASDIELSSPQIAPTHLQIHYLPEAFGSKVMNLGDEVKVVRGEYQEVLRSYASTELANGDEILLGDYRIRVQLPIITKTVQTSHSLSATLLFENSTLYDHSPSTGWLTIKNTGEQSPCQFHVSVSGIPADCIKIDPIPVLYAGAEEEVRVQIFHQGLYPLAGFNDLTIRVFAPSDYPGEQVLIEQGIYVMPVFRQHLVIGDDAYLDDNVDEIAAPEPDLNMVAQSTVSSAPSKMPPPPPPEEKLPIPVEIEASQPPAEIVEEEIEISLPVSVEKEMPVKEEKPVLIEKPVPKPVIVRDLPAEFWDEE